MENQIVLIKRKETKTGSPMWACWCSSTNTWVNVFKDHEVSALVYAGYPEIQHMEMNQELHWKTSPIKVRLTQNGQWWNLVSVEPRSPEAMPDPIYIPNLQWYKNEAIRRARRLLKDGLFFDTETNGTDNFSEILTIHCATPNETMLDLKIKPQNMAAVQATTHVHHITPESLENCPTFEQVAPDIKMIMAGDPWVAWNVKFDVGQLERAFMRADQALPLHLGFYDAMEIYAWYCGLWDEVRQEWKPIKLGEAAKNLGIEVDEAHEAGADVDTMIKVMKVIAG